MKIPSVLRPKIPAFLRLLWSRLAPARWNQRDKIAKQFEKDAEAFRKDMRGATAFTERVCGHLVTVPPEEGDETV